MFFFSLQILKFLGQYFLQVQVMRPTQRADQSQTPLHHQPIMQNVYGVGGNGYIGNNGSHFRTRKIFVGGLPDTLTEYEFGKFFERFGKITDVVIIPNKSTGKRRGFGFITFELDESVELVMRRNYYYLHGKYVEVKRAIPKMANDCTNGCNSANGDDVGGGSESIQGPSSFSPHYPPHGPCPGYGSLPGCGKSGPVAYVMCTYSALSPIPPGSHSHAQSPFHGNGSFRGSVMGVPIQNNSEMRVVHNQVNEVGSSRIEACEAEDVSHRIGYLKLDDRASGRRGASSS